MTILLLVMSLCGILESSLATFTDIVHMTKHEIQKVPKQSSKETAAVETLSHGHHKQRLDIEAQTVTARRKVTETPECFIEVVQVATHDVKGQYDNLSQTKSKLPVRAPLQSGNASKPPALSENMSCCSGVG